MSIFLLEDSHQEANLITVALGKRLPHEAITRIQTESEFREKFASIAANPPAIFIIDISLRWADPSPNLRSRPADVKLSEQTRAGFRCIKMLSEDERTKEIPVVFYSNFEWPSFGEVLTTLPANVVQVRRRDSERFVSAVCSLLDQTTDSKSLQNVFIVHGRDQDARREVVQFVEQLGFAAIVLQEQASKGRTIIEKFEEYSNVVFAIVLLTPDDVGGLKQDEVTLQPRARQNVIFEFGFFVAKLGRHSVCALTKNVEIPSDYHGVVYLSMDEGGEWRTQLASEMSEAGLSLGLTKLG